MQIFFFHINKSINDSFINNVNTKFTKIAHRFTLINHENDRDNKKQKKFIALRAMIRKTTNNFVIKFVFNFDLFFDERNARIFFKKKVVIENKNENV